MRHTGMKTEETKALSECRLFWEVHVPSILAISRHTGLASLNVDAGFRVHGPGGGEWSVVVRRGDVESVSTGGGRIHDVTVRLDEETFLGIARGEVDHKEAFFSGRIEIDGDISLALEVANFIPVLRDRFPFEPEGLKARAS